MRMQRGAVIVSMLACTLVLAALSGCSSAPAPTPAPTPTTDAPLFESDEEALAAATEAYAAYLKASDESWLGGETTREDFLALSTGQAHKDDVAAGELFEERDWRKIGTTSFDSMRVQSSGSVRGDIWEVRTYLCVDVSASDVVDAEGTSVAKVDRLLRTPLEVVFVTGSSKTRNLMISESQVWSGENFC